MSWLKEYFLDGIERTNFGNVQSTTLIYNPNDIQRIVAFLPIILRATLSIRPLRCLRAFTSISRILDCASLFTLN